MEFDPELDGLMVGSDVVVTVGYPLLDTASRSTEYLFRVYVFDQC